MPTLATASQRGTTVLGAPPRPHPLLTQEDLDDPRRFTTIPGVPILDIHRDEKRGTIDPTTLDRILRNTTALTARGDFPVLSLGHLIPRANPHGMTIEHPDGESIRIDRDSEEAQPKPVGYASRWRIGLFKGRPTLHCDYHIHNHLYDEARDYPFRSAERLKGPEYIDRVALLRRPPERDLGAIDYSRFGPPGERVLYARDFPPIDMSPKADETEETETDPSAELRSESEVDPTPPPESGPGPATEPSATASPGTPPEQEVPSSDGAPSSTDPTNSNNPSPEEESHMPLTPEDLESIKGIFREFLSEEFAGAEGSEVAPEDQAPEIPSESVDPPARDMHAAEVGGMDTTVPELDAEEEPTRESYARNLALIDRAFGATDDRLTQNDEQLKWVADRLVAVEKQLADAQVENRRLVYKKELIDTRGDGYHTLTDAKIADLLSKIEANTPADHEARTIEDIRENYTRSPVGASRRIPIGPPDIGSANGNGAPTVAELRMAQAYAADPRNKCGDFSAALAHVRKK